MKLIGTTVGYLLGVLLYIFHVVAISTIFVCGLVYLWKLGYGLESIMGVVVILIVRVIIWSVEWLKPNS